MPLVTIKPKFQVTIPAELRRGNNLREGDVMEATLMGSGILLRPMEFVDRANAAVTLGHECCRRPQRPGGRGSH